MAKTYTWIGPSGIAAAATISADWSPAGGPPTIGDTGIIARNGTALAGDGPLKSNTVILSGGRLTFGGDTLVTLAGPSAIAGGLAPVRGEAIIEGGGTLETAAAYDPTVTGTDQIYYFGDVTAGNTLKVDNIGSFSGRQRILRQRHHRPGLPTRGRDTGSQHRDERPEPGE